MIANKTKKKSKQRKKSAKAVEKFEIELEKKDAIINALNLEMQQLKNKPSPVQELQVADGTLLEENIKLKEWNACLQDEILQ